jgi:N6-L-threonylcarbamoyladenine synthase
VKVLGIETSCDETAVGIVEDGQILHANAVVSQIDIHAVYGGVVPEVAARSHIEAMIPTLDTALNTTFPALSNKTTEEKMAEIDAIAVTYGAGLGGSLLIGIMTARELALAANKPLYAINHVEGHVYANFLTKSLIDGYKLPETAPKFPLLALIVSGGHTQLVLFHDHFKYEVLGKTQDDAIGEAFDKIAKMTGLPYPGGPSIAKEAEYGDAHSCHFPKARLEGEYDFSFSGLKTAVLRSAQQMVGADHTLSSLELPSRLSVEQKRNIAASFQRIAVETVVDKTMTAFGAYKPVSVVIAGGVASSQELRKQLAERLPIAPVYTDPKLCTDNGAMIATLGCYKAMYGASAVDPYSLEINPTLKM